MPRRPRVFVDGATYHVYCRAARGEAVFRRADDARDFLEIVAEVKRQDGFAVLAWCVMPTHYHLVVQTGSAPLWKSMRLIQGRFSKSFNRRHDVFGPVWQGRYNAKLVAGERYLQQAIVYVHANPLAAKLAGSPGAFPWSGHREFESGADAPLLDADEMLLAFGGRRGDARASYLQALAGAGSVAGWRALSRLPWWRSAGDGDEIVPPAGRPRLDALGASTFVRPTLPIAEFIASSAAVLGTTEEEIRASGSGREMTRRREAATLVGVEQFRYRVAELAAQFGRAPSVVSRWGVTAVRLRREDAAFREQVAALAAALTARSAGSPGSDVEEAILGADSSFID
jgi:REP element-mobilizing transposase RayT